MRSFENRRIVNVNLDSLNSDPSNSRRIINGMNVNQEMDCVIQNRLKRRNLTDSFEMERNRFVINNETMINNETQQHEKISHVSFGTNLKSYYFYNYTGVVGNYEDLSGETRWDEIISFVNDEMNPESCHLYNEIQMNDSIIRRRCPHCANRGHLGVNCLRDLVHNLKNDVEYWFNGYDALSIFITRKYNVLQLKILLKMFVYHFCSENHPIIHEDELTFLETVEEIVNLMYLVNHLPKINRHSRHSEETEIDDNDVLLSEIAEDVNVPPENIDEILREITERATIPFSPSSIASPLVIDTNPVLEEELPNNSVFSSWRTPHNEHSTILEETLRNEVPSNPDPNHLHNDATSFIPFLTHPRPQNHQLTQNYVLPSNPSYLRNDVFSLPFSRHPLSRHPQNQNHVGWDVEGWEQRHFEQRSTQMNNVQRSTQNEQRSTQRIENWILDNEEEEGEIPETMKITFNINDLQIIDDEDNTTPYICSLCYVSKKSDYKTSIHCNINCKHLYCFDCLFKAIQTQNKCPYCLGKIKNIHMTKTLSGLLHSKRNEYHSNMFEDTDTETEKYLESLNTPTPATPATTINTEDPEINEIVNHYARHYPDTYPENTENTEMFNHYNPMLERLLSRSISTTPATIMHTENTEMFNHYNPMYNDENQSLPSPSPPSLFSRLLSRSLAIPEDDIIDRRL